MEQDEDEVTCRLAGDAGALEPLVREVADALVAGAARRAGPVPAGTP
ncbi:MAG: hypothetical protein HOV96_36415, partial [Nonomuraea sp.]|nr:hypothetical protein [Nonomuraea sp.]